MKNPKVSIIIPVYNGANYLREAIESALAQTYNNTEILVINDGSTDNGATENIALSFGDTIKYISKENGGVSTALNLGIEKASGAYISWLSHDDLYHREKIEKSLNYMMKYEGKYIIFTDYELIDTYGKTLQSIKSPSQTGEIFFKIISNQFALNGCTLLIPKVAFEEVGYFDVSLKTTQDYHMWVRMLRAGYQFLPLGDSLTRYRIHENQDSIKKKEIFLKELQYMQIYIFKIFKKEEIKELSHYKGNAELISLKIKFIYAKQNTLGYITILTQKLGIYDSIAPLYRKLFVK